MVVQDMFLNETAKFAHVFLPGSSFLEKDGTFTNAERRISPRAQGHAPRRRPGGLGSDACACRMRSATRCTTATRREIMDEIARLTPTFTGVSYEKIDRLGSIQWPCNDEAPEGTPVMHVEQFVRGKGKFVITEYVPTERARQLASIRCCSPPAESSPSTTSARRRAARPTCSGTTRTCSRSTRTMPSSAASTTATGSASQPRRRDGAARRHHRAHAARRRLHDVPLPGLRRERRHDGKFRLGDQLPGVQGHRRAGDAVMQPSTWQKSFSEFIGCSARAACAREGEGLMDTHRLVKMVNDIANFFNSEPDHQLAVEGVAGHIRRFWDPRMRRELIKWLDEHDGEGLQPLALEALRANRETLMPQAVRG